MSNKQIAVSIITFIAIIVYAPLMNLWALETIFQFKIIYSFWSWLAMSWFHLIIFLIILLTKSSSSTTTVTATITPELLKSVIDNSKKEP